MCYSLRQVEKKYILQRQVVTRQKPDPSPHATWAVAEADLLPSSHIQALSSKVPLSLAIKRGSWENIKHIHRQPMKGSQSKKDLNWENKKGA